MLVESGEDSRRRGKPRVENVGIDDRRPPIERFESVADGIEERAAVETLGRLAKGNDEIPFRSAFHAIEQRLESIEAMADGAHLLGHEDEVDRAAVDLASQRAQSGLKVEAAH